VLLQRSIHAAVLAAAFLCCAVVVQAQRAGCIFAAPFELQLRAEGIAEKTAD